MQVVIAGAGYVGLISGSCFAEFGVNVVCVDLDATRIERLTKGEIHIYKPGLDQLAASNVKTGRLSFTMDLSAAV